ncbi:transposase [Candidatus Acetothermia bacterium]|nr:MAG: transposase [Candidatus Acetothermia bacterium]
MSDRQLETVKLTARLKLDGETCKSLFETYKVVVNELLDYAHSKGITSFERLKSEKYHEMREKYPELPSHYIYTACQLARSIYKSFRKLKRRGKVKKDRPLLRKDVIMLDDHLFKLDLENWTVSISTPDERSEFKLLHGEYHGKFKDWKAGQAWLIKRTDGIYLNVVFSKNVEIRDYKDIVGVDVNENNVTTATNQGFIMFETKERVIRTAYFLKRRKISKIRCRRVKAEVLAKYRGRERKRVLDIYHKVANEIVKVASKTNSAIALENLKEIRKRINYSKELNGRLHRWSFRKFQQILEYKAKLNGIEVIYVNPHKTSSLCPICGRKLSPNGHRLLKCGCGLIADRDVVGSWNIRLRSLKIDVGSSVPPESQPMSGGWKVIRHDFFESYESSGEPERKC